MDPFVKVCEELFSAAKSEFKILNIIISIIAFMNLFGKTITEEMKIESIYKIFLINLEKTLKLFL